ncbi:hypothetical protein [Streptomyces luteogriseus]|uniref:hypothetical protein n=1 Tax=Streptomyces luteogriseus TaxID=68233 RepID=UPI0037BCEBDA
MEPDLELLALKRQLVWDMVQHSDLADPENQLKFGLSPASQEVMRKEHEAAHIRIAGVFPFYGRIQTLSGLAALVVKPLILDLLDVTLDEEERDAKIGALFTIASTAILADLIDKELVVWNLQERH